MRNVFRVGLLLSFSSVTAAFAQSDEVDVDMNANVNVNVGVQAGPGGASINMNAGDTHVHTRRTTVIVQPQIVEPQIIERRETVIIQQPAPPPQRPLYRDCGTGTDPGCTLTKDGNLPMDAETFRGVMGSLKATANELVRLDMAEKILNRNYLTALQFGQFLDLFTNELTRLDAAKFAAPHVVNPQHALGFAAKWKNSLTGADYTELMTDQH